MPLTRPPDMAGTIDDVAFAAAMEPFAPFEPGPSVAVAVSGGPDSMALALLLDRWARARGGSALALTVDHGLRTESAAEARWVGDRLAARGIPHAILPWVGPKPTSSIQEGARSARYALLIEACARQGLLHLAIAHQADDQAETVLFREERGSGRSGLSGMAASRSLGATRLIRPLLAWPKAALIATCRAAGQEFIEDPSNEAPRFARTGLRNRLATDPEQRTRLLVTARSAGLERRMADGRLAAILARTTETRPDGALAIDLDAADADIRPEALSAALRMVGGGLHPPTREAVAALARIATETGFRGGSLAGCLIRPFRGRLLIVREPGRTARPIELVPGRWTPWDGRFRLRLGPSAESGYVTGALGRDRYAEIRRLIKSTKPALIAATLPAVCIGGRLVAVPGLGWLAPDAPPIEQRFATLWPLAPERFTVVYDDARIICHTEDARPAGDRLS